MLKNGRCEFAPKQTRKIPVSLLPSRFPATFAMLVFELEQNANWRRLLPYTRPYQPDPGRPRDPRAKELDALQSAAELLYLWRGYGTVGDLLEAMERCQLQDVADSLIDSLQPEDAGGGDFLRLGSASDRGNSPTGGLSERRTSIGRIQLPEKLCHSPKRCNWDDAMLAVRQGSLLGRGGYASVYKGQWRDMDVAIKFFENLESKVMREMEESTVRMCRVQHPNVVMLLGFAEPESAKVRSLVHILEFAVHGDLRRQLDLFEESRAEMPDFDQFVTRLSVAIQVAGAIEYLHSLTETQITMANQQRNFYFVHKDIKSANVLLTNGWQCKLSDLDFLDVSTIGDGTTSLLDQRQRSPTIFGTEGFYPPADNRLTCAWDVYSFGVTLLEIFTGRPAVSPDTRLPSGQRLLSNCVANGESFSLAGAGPQPGLSVAEAAFRDLCLGVVQPMLSRNKNLRPQMPRVRQQLEQLFNAAV